ncbi:MAG: 2-hydroxymuconic semialdehyde dehydrogenase [Bacteroidetes bacterium]|nr:MAG: 2-hydroxymuconic semialdehyde dehydrogenase [Bacteroidota bacterium]
MIKLQNYINGELISPVNDNWLDNYEPARGKVYSQIPDSDADDIALAVEAAKAAFPSWSKTSIDERHDCLMRIASLIEEKLDMLAAAESRDNGKPLKLATRVDIPRAASNFRFYATAAMQFSSEAHPMPGMAINYTLRQPLGVVGCISPWNLPLYLFSWKIAPALATGNTVVAKPSEITPMTAYLLSEICIEAGLPKGVLNIVHGLGHKAGAAIVDDPAVTAISFTGGTKTGAAIAAQAAPKFKKLSLELGGKNPNIIFADCDFNKMISTTMHSSFANQGQICLCGSRIYVQRSIYDQFKEEFVKRTKALTVGDPADPETKLGAIVSEPHMEKILSYVALAQEEGGTVLAGGHRVQFDGDLADGWYVEPTIIDGLAPGCRTNQEEIFGPVVTITPFDTEEEALELANGTQYGLSCTIWTEDLTRAHRMAENIHAGIVWINCWLLRDLRTPFGGTKQSGVGREGGFEAMRFFTEPKNVCIKYG